MTSGDSKHRNKLVVFIFSLILLIGSQFFIKIILQENNIISEPGKSNIVVADITSNLLSELPLRFISNQGQINSNIKFHVEGIEHTILFSENRILFSKTNTENKRSEVELDFINANPNPKIKGIKEQPGKTNFFIGSDPKNWQTDVKSYDAVRYSNLYPGIDIAYLSKEGKLKSEFYVSSGADYKQIRMHYNGIKSKLIKEDGSLVLSSQFGDIIEKKPVVYQKINGEKKFLESNYIIYDEQTIGFNIINIDAGFPLVIDPEFSYATYLGGNGYSVATGIALDSTGHIIVGGITRATNFPVQNPYQSGNEGGYDAFVCKIDTSTGTFIYSTYFGSSGWDQVNDMKMDNAGNVYIVGYSDGANLPTTANALQTERNGFGKDAFIAKFDPNGSLLYSTYLGGGKDESDIWGTDEIRKIAIGPNGEMYVAGRTNTIDFPLSSPIQAQLNGDYDAFFARINPEGDSLLFSTYFGGSGEDDARGIDIDYEGNMYIGGTTQSVDLQTFSALQDSLKGESDAFLLKFDPLGNNLIYSTYFGGSGIDQAYDLAVDSAGYTYIVGRTFSDDFPVKSNSQSINYSSKIRMHTGASLDASDGFFSMFDPTGIFRFSELTAVVNTDFFVAATIMKFAAYYYIITGGYVQDGWKLYFYINDFGEISLERVSEEEVNGYTQIKDITTIDDNMAVAMGTDHLFDISENAIMDDPNPDDPSDDIYVWAQKYLLAKLDVNLAITDLNGIPVDSVAVGEIYNMIITIKNVSSIDAINVRNTLYLGPETLEFIDIPSDWIRIGYLLGNDMKNLSAGDEKTFVITFIKKEIGLLSVGLSSRAVNANLVETSLYFTGIKSKKSAVILFFSNIFQQSILFNKINANESIDVFIDSVLVFDNLSGNSPQSADFELSTATPAFEITTSDAVDNSNPLASFHPDLMMGEGDDIYLPSNFGFMITEVEPDSFKLLLKKNMRSEALDSNKIDLFITHGAENLGSIDIRLIDDDTSPDVIETLYDNIEPDSVTEYVSLIPGNNYLQITNADNSQQYGTFNFNLSSYSGEALFGSVVSDSQLTSTILLLYDSEGNIIEEGGTTSIGESGPDALPTVYELYNNFPNPFNPSTTIKYSVPKQSYVTLKVYDILGREVATLTNEEKRAGNYKVEFHTQQTTNHKQLSSGVYFYRIEAGSFNQVRKMLLIK